jgi:hypothetical protein
LRRQGLQRYGVVASHPPMMPALRSLVDACRSADLGGVRVAS